KAEAAAKPAAAPAATAAPAKAAPPTSTNGQIRVLASPFARKLALEKGVDLRQVAGSGPRGRIVKRDIDEAVAGGGAQPAAPAALEGGGDEEPKTPAPSLPLVEGREDTLVAPSQMRKTIARRLVEAKREIPHIYLTAEATVDKLLQMREQLNEIGDIKISVND